MKRPPTLAVTGLLFAVSGLPGWPALRANPAPPPGQALRAPATPQVQHQLFNPVNGTSGIGEGMPMPAWARALSDLEFSRLQVELPRPENLPWRSPFYDSESVLAGKNKETVVEILPMWIRRGYIADEPPRGLIPRYLHTLIRLTGDTDPVVARDATFGLYRLGDYDQTALRQMKKWIETDASHQANEYSFGVTESLDVRAQVLRELEFVGDRRLDAAIYAAWEKHKADEEARLAAVDYGYYLEKHGRPLPLEYWLERVRESAGLANALKVLERRNPPGLVQRLDAVLQRNREYRTGHLNPRAAFLAASSLWALTGQTEYRDYLGAQLELALRSNLPDLSTEIAFAGLARRLDDTGLALLARGITNENSVVVEDALVALGQNPSPQVTQILANSATESINKRKYFPERQLRALLSQNTPLADERYALLRAMLLSGELGWQQQTVDFDRLEFYRKYMRPGRSPAP